jgi:hypothetical protein
MTDRMKKAIERGLALQRIMAKGDPQSLPHAYLLDPEDEVSVMAFTSDFMKDGRSKLRLSQFILVNMFKTNSLSVFVSDAWEKIVGPGWVRLPGSLRDLPENQRGEVLLAFGNEIGEEGVFVKQSYKRDSSGIAIFGEITWNPPVLDPRFVFDLRDKDLGKALMQTLHRGGLRGTSMDGAVEMPN